MCLLVCAVLKLLMIDCFQDRGYNGVRLADSSYGACTFNDIAF